MHGRVGGGYGGARYVVGWGTHTTDAHRTSPWGEILGRASRPERPMSRTEHPDRAGPLDPCSTTRPRAWTCFPPFIKAGSPLGTSPANCFKDRLCQGERDLISSPCRRGGSSRLAFRRAPSIPDGQHAPVCMWRVVNLTSYYLSGSWGITPRPFGVRTRNPQPCSESHCGLGTGSGPR